MTDLTNPMMPDPWQRDAEPVQVALGLGESLRLVTRRHGRARRRTYQPRRHPVSRAFVRFPVEVLRDLSLSAAARLLWGFLATYATGVDLNGRGGIVQQPNGRPLGLGQLAADTGAGHSTVRRLLEELETAGHLLVEGQTGSRLTIRVLWIANNPPEAKRAQF